MQIATTTITDLQTFELANLYFFYITEINCTASVIWCVSSVDCVSTVFLAVPKCPKTSIHLFTKKIQN